LSFIFLTLYIGFIVLIMVHDRRAMYNGFTNKDAHSVEWFETVKKFLKLASINMDTSHPPCIYKYLTSQLIVHTLWSCASTCLPLEAFNVWPITCCHSSYVHYHALLQTSATMLFFKLQLFVSAHCQPHDLWRGRCPRHMPPPLATTRL
jgi:hypothetical protein